MNDWAYLTGVGKRDGPLGAFAGSWGAKCIGPDHSFLGGLSIFWGFADPHSGLMVRCWRDGLPFFHLDHAYFKRGYEHGNFRVNFGHFHQTRLLDVPSDRGTLARKRLEPWKRDGRDIVVVVPSDSICNVLGMLSGTHLSPKDWARETEEELKRWTDRPVIRKYKGGSILDVLRTAFAVVSLSSVAEVEAAVRGIPVFVGKHSPATQIGQPDLSKIEHPSYPDRERWLDTLSYSQFNMTEFRDGTAAAILRDLYLCSPQPLAIAN